MQEHRFTGKDPIRTLDFLTRFVMEAIVQGIREAQYFIALLTFLTVLARSEYETGVVVTGSQSEGIFVAGDGPAPAASLRDRVENREWARGDKRPCPEGRVV